MKWLTQFGFDPSVTRMRTLGGSIVLADRSTGLCGPAKGVAILVLLILAGSAYTLIMHSYSIQGNKIDSVNNKVMILTETFIICVQCDQMEKM